jgi:hypothetical protein
MKYLRVGIEEEIIDMPLQIPTTQSELRRKTMREQPIEIQENSVKYVP